MNLRKLLKAIIPTSPRKFEHWIVALLLIVTAVMLLKLCSRDIAQVPQADKHIPDSVFHAKPLEITLIPPVQIAVPTKVDVYKADSLLRKKAEETLKKGNIPTKHRIIRNVYQIEKIDTDGKGYKETHPYNSEISIIEVDIEGNVKITTDKKALRRLKWKRTWATVKTTTLVVGTAVTTAVVTVIVIKATNKDEKD